MAVLSKYWYIDRERCCRYGRCLKNLSKDVEIACWGGVFAYFVAFYVLAVLFTLLVLPVTNTEGRGGDVFVASVSFIQSPINTPIYCIPTTFDAVRIKCQMHGLYFV